MHLHSFSLRRGFTLMELMITISIILVLTAMVIGAGSFAQDKARRSRAQSEISAMETALESYKTDNGAYPTSSTTVGAVTFPNPRDGTTDFPMYTDAATILYQSLSGKTDSRPGTLATTKIYMEFKASQVDQTNFNMVIDPWRHPYGYSYAQSTNPSGNFYDPSQKSSFNTNFVDLWSTGGVDSKTGKPNPNNKWITSWAN